MSDVKQLQSYLACPRCDKSPLSFDEGKFGCDACKIQFPDIDGIPWMFADPETSLGEWRNRLQFALQQLSHEISGLERELKNEEEREFAATDAASRRALQEIDRAAPALAAKIAETCRLAVDERQLRVISRAPHKNARGPGSQYLLRQCPSRLVLG
jgi:uncharacterized protein YbaR (Trm112 family)